MAPRKTGGKSHGGWRAAVAGIAALLTPTAGFAESATLLSTLICKDPRDSVDAHWAQQRHNSNAMFFMWRDGHVEKISTDPGSSNFDDYSTVYIAIHGGIGSVGKFEAGEFARFFQAAHPSTPDLVYFDSCSAGAKAPDNGDKSNLRTLNEEYRDAITKLEGPQGSCSLVGDGNSKLADAINRSGVKHSDDERWSQVKDNITNIWNRSFLDKCNRLMAGGGSKRDIFNFIEEAYNEFVVKPPADADYLELIKLNVGGQDFLVCGAGNQQPCP